MVVPHVLAKKSRMTPERVLATARGTGKAHNTMTKLKNLKARLMRDAEFQEECARIDEEYALIMALARILHHLPMSPSKRARRVRTGRNEPCPC